MKFLITAVTLSTLTRRRRGKARTDVVDTETPEYFGITDPAVIEYRYEALHNEPTQSVKVVDVRALSN